MLLWTFVYKFLQEHSFSFLLGRQLGIVGLYMHLYLSQEKSFKVFSKVAAPFYTYHQQCMKVAIFPHSQWHLVLSVCLIVAILVESLHMDITRWSTPKSDWLYSLQPKMEKLYIVSKNKTGSWLWLRSWTPYCQI